MGHALLLLCFALSAWAADDLPYPIRQELRHAYAPPGPAIPLALFDADQTIRVSRSPYRAPRRPEEVLVLPEVREKILELNRKGYFVGIISNQENPVRDSGQALIDRTMAETVRQLEQNGAKINYVDFSTGAEESKPAPVMFRRLVERLRGVYGRDVHPDAAKSFMVGDAAYLKPGPGIKGELRPDGRPGLDTSNFDRKFAENSGLRFYEPQGFFGWDQLGVERFDGASEVTRYLGRKAAGPGGCAASFGRLDVNAAP